MTEATPRTARVAAAVALALFAVVGALQGAQPVAVVVPVVGAVVALGAWTAWRDATGWALVGQLTAAAVGVVVLCHGNPGNAGWFAMCVIAGWAAFGAPVLPGVVLCLGLLATFVIEWAFSAEHGWPPWLAGTAFTAVAAVFAQRQRQLAVQLHAAQAGLADRARAEERSRIAGEVHDVIGHALTVTLLHLGSARLALDEGLDGARAALDDAERVTRSSLAEVRATIGLTRPAGLGDTSPLPAAGDVDALVDSFRNAGATIDVEIIGDLRHLGSGHGLTLYRIVQESLTNAVRHGDGSPITVRVDAAEGETRVVTTNGRHASGVPADGTGLIGMRTRAEAVGGRLSTTPSPGGWRVEAILPS